MTEKEMLLFSLKRYEEKLKELMSEDDFHAFAVEVAKEGFRKEVEGMADGGLKDFCLINFDAVTGTDDEWQAFCGAGEDEE